MKAEQLRKSILQMAIQGKLVPQGPNDEPASLLLEKIRAEKQRLIKEGKIKKDKVDSVIFKGDDNRHYEKVGNEVKDITDEIDFELPNGWEFARINSLVNIQTGASFKKEQVSNDKSKVRVLRGGNILNGMYSFFENDLFIDRSLISDSILLHKNDLLTPAVTSIENIGKLALINCDYNNVTAGGFVFIIRPIYTNSTFAKYLLYSLQSAYFNKQMKAITKKSGQAFYNLGKERLIKLILPIPPLAEQERIVAEIEKYEPLIAEYDKLEQQKTKLDGEIYDKLKKSILQYAIQGKLIPQDENDEPASELLKRIRAEKKAQPGKKYVDSYIYKGDDNCYYEHIDGKAKDEVIEIPFDLPNNWVWSKLKDIAFTQTGTTPTTSNPNNFGTYIPFIKPGDILDGTINYDNEGLSQIGLTNGRLIRQNSILMVCIGGSLGKCAICDRDVSCNQQINTATPETCIEPQYLFYCLLSDYFYKAIKDKATGTATPIINRSLWENTFVPIPPLAEQKRIVEKINEIFVKL